MYSWTALLLVEKYMHEVLQKEYGCLGSSTAAWEGWYLKCALLS